jgi:hypothetical protein
MQDVAASIGNRIGATWKIANCDLPRSQIFDLGEPQNEQFGVELVRFKIVDPRLTQLRDARRP